MYTVDWAENFIGFSKGEQIDLHKFVQFYDECIAYRDFTYATSSPLIPYFVVESKPSQLPHLMALQHWNNLPVKQATKQYEFLKSGEWDLEYLAKADQGAFQEHQARINFLPYLYNYLYNYKCDIKIINKNTPSSFKNRNIDMIFQHAGVKLAYILELRKKKDDGPYVLTSLTVHNKKAQALKIKTTPVKITDLLIEKNTDDQG